MKFNKILFLFVISIFFLLNGNSYGKELLYINNTIYISTDNNSFYNPFTERIYFNISGKFIGEANEDSNIIFQNNKKYELLHNIVIHNNKVFISLDDYRKFWSFNKKITKFSIIDLYDKGTSTCFVIPQFNRFSYLKKYSNRKSKITIVIDPGHGGEDSGAVGPHCLKEKDVVFSIAGKLADIFAEKTNYNIYLSRYEDYYITLENRSQLSNKLSADIFISIHANAAPRTAAEGVETFYFSNHTSDNEAKFAANLENKWAESTGEIKKNKTVNSIVSDMLQTRVSNESAKLANIIQKNIIDITSEFNRGTKRANFWVLKGTKMPAILIETGFISNEDEEEKLSSPKYQNKIAEGIFKGIMKFINTEKIKGEYNAK